MASSTLQIYIEQSELGQKFLCSPLINQDSWSLLELGFSQEELDLKSRRYLHFENFGLTWLKYLSKLTALQQRNEQFSLSRIEATVSLLNRLDAYIQNKGWSQPKDLSQNLLRDFIAERQALISKQSLQSEQSLLVYALRLWNEEGWLNVNYIPLKSHRVTPKIEAIPEHLLYEFYGNLHCFPSMLERLFRLQLALGWRIGELLQTPRNCLKHEEEHWYIKRWIEKRKIWQFAQIHPVVAEVVRAQQRFLDAVLDKTSNFDFLFCWLSAAPQHVYRGSINTKRLDTEPAYAPKVLPRQTANAWLRSYGEYIGLKDLENNSFRVTSHMLRRTKAMIMAYCETEDEYIAAVLGHSNLEMLPHYREASLKRLERQSEQNFYVDFHGQVTTFKPKRTRYEQLHDRIMVVHTQLGECHQPWMLEGCELQYACLICKYHRVTLRDRPLLEGDLANLKVDLERAKSYNNTRKITEISRLIEVIEVRLEGLERAELLLQEKDDDCR